MTGSGRKSRSDDVSYTQLTFTFHKLCTIGYVVNVSFFQPPNPETEKILGELQGIRDSCSNEFKRFEKLLNEKKSKLDTFEDCIVAELRELQRKYEELKIENAQHVSKIAELEEKINEKTERVKKFERKLTQAKNERDELKGSIEKDYVTKSEYSEVWEQLEEQQKVNHDLQLSEEAARNRLDKVVAVRMLYSHVLKI